MTSHVILMARPAIPGRVKTRLIPQLGADRAAAVHAAMLRCVMHRWAAAVSEVASPHHAPQLVLALADADAPSAAPIHAIAQVLPPHLPPWRIIDQGAGDLGQRMSHVWQEIGGGAAAFLGVDSPDLPRRAIARTLATLAARRHAVGPAIDGGYWTLVAPSLDPRLLAGVDWGTASVYHQTTRIMHEAGMPWQALPPWFDVDTPADLRRLCRRLARQPQARSRTDMLARGHATPCTGHAPGAQAADDRTADETPSTEPDADAALSLLRHELATLTRNTLMTSDSTPKDTSAPRPTEVDITGSTILIVDDNQQNVELLQAYLEALPCQTLTASDGLEAMRLIQDPKQPRPDLILLDVMMPRMSGFEVCQKLKSDPEHHNIPIMMVTALNEIGDIERGVESGTDDFVSKPVNKLELITRVKSLLRLRHLKRELDRTLAYMEDMGSASEET